MPPPASPIRAILFDKDGTLTDFRATWEGWLAGTLRDLAAASGRPVTTLGAAVGFDMGHGRLRPDALFVTATEPETMGALAAAAAWPLSDLRRWLARRNVSVVQVEAVPVAPLLRTLRGRGLALGILTNANEVEARHHLGRMNALPLLDMVIGQDSGHGPKPTPHGALAFAAAMGLDPAEVVLVGDGMTDMQAARGAGMVAVGVTTGTLDPAALAPHAEAVLPDVAALPGWLDARQPRIDA